MKNIFRKLLCFAAVSVMLFSQYASAYEFINVTRTQTNNEFAFACADVVNSNNPKVSGSSLNTAVNAMRIIGKTSDPYRAFNSYSAKKCVIGADGRFLMQFSDYSDYINALEKLNSEPDIIYAEADALVSTSGATEEEKQNLSWGVSALGLDKYSKALSGDSSLGDVTVAIVDTGAAELDFLKDKLVEGYDFVDNDKNAFHDGSSDSHGTFIAGIVADCVKDAAVNIMPVRVIDSKSGYISNVINGIRYAADNGADVINISLHGNLMSCSSVDDAFDYVESKNVTAVVCAGNFKKDTAEVCPAHVESAITVSAIDENFEFASAFSDFGEAVDVCAPGVNIVGYGADGTLKIMNGTSMSAAFISAGAALFRLQHPECNPSQVQEAIRKSCVDFGEKGFDLYYGYGLPNFNSFTQDAAVYVDGISFESESVSAKLGETIELTPIISPADATTTLVTWSIDDESIIRRVGDRKFKCLSAGLCTVTATTVDGGFSASVSVSVSEETPDPVLTGIAVKTPPSNITYTYKTDKTIDLSGLVLELTYSDGSKKTVAQTDGIVASGFNPSSAGEQKITVEYEGFSTSYTVVVEYSWWQWIIRILLLGFLWY